jgi:murein DD-endopeptidase MepM/ murein hydrolase activator NlpD
MHRGVAVAVAVVMLSAMTLIVTRIGVSDPAPGIPPIGVSAQATGMRVGSGKQATRIADAQPVIGTHPTVDAKTSSYSLPQADPAIVVTQVSAHAALRDNPANATSSASVARIELFGGRIVIDDAALSVTAAVKGGVARGAFERGGDWIDMVDGARKRVRVNTIVTLTDIGTITLNEQALASNAPTGDDQTGPRFRGVGAIAHLRLTARVGQLKPGTDIVIGRVDAGVREGKIAAIDHPGAGVISRPSTPNLPAGLQPGAPKPGDSSLPRADAPVRAKAGGATGSLAGYTFPVLGRANYTDSWGAARASTGVPHQGTDIFAAEGTPVVAVADGVLDRVGWNTIGGYRFWLFDRYGNSFYNAHLSAFSPLAVDGAFVRKGDVIGFVGHTGDAQFTPSHLHFEIHPGNGDATNPFRFLNKWRHGIATLIGKGAFASGPGAIGATAVTGFADIAPNSGLDPTVLDQVPPGTRPVMEETKPQDTAETLKSAISGDPTSGE